MIQRSLNMNVSPNFALGQAQPRIIQMKYADVKAYLLNNISTFSANIYRTNSIYDPDYTGTGHQPMGHDEWSTLYNKYCVLAMDIKSTFVASNAGSVEGGSSFLGSITVQNGTATGGITELKLEDPNTKTKVVPNSKNNYSHTPAVSLYHRWRADQWWGASQEEVMAQDVCQASFGGSPIRQAHVAVQVQQIDGLPTSSASYIWDVTTEIVYTVYLFEPKTMNQS